MRQQLCRSGRLRGVGRRGATRPRLRRPLATARYAVVHSQLRAAAYYAAPPARDEPPRAGARAAA
eukprot:COSAG01_NODE_11406_length_1942_cov_3.136734_1_plen_64_part_10